MRVVLISAFMDPESVGEPRWCYDLAKGIADRVETVVISQKPLIAKASISELFPTSQVFEIDGWTFNWLNRRMRALIKPGFIRFYQHAAHVLRHRIDKASITCGHQFGPLGMRYPTPLRNWGVPYVIGPLGGSLPLPPGLDVGERKDPWYYKLRDLDGLRFRHDPMLRSSYANAGALVGVGDYVRDVLHDIPLRRFETHSQRVAQPAPVDVEPVITARRNSSGPLRLLIAGRLIHSKGVHYALRALAQASPQLPEWRLDIAGDGYYRPVLEGLAQSLGIADRITFHGHRKRIELDAFYTQADILLFPTIREPSGAVIFEAMSWGVPIITADYGGPATHVLPGFGIKAPVTSEAAFVDGIADALVRMGNDPGLREQMGREGLHVARTKHSLPAMVDFFTRIYGEIGKQ
ncbi:glycosyltransferase family 4 protein [Sphingomonas sp. FW199]|uniref:glycosyltransferase family 4 protein n=1 Tax=Sphingomonas sp. FW199 TaxID=3400217 RepID=UPI003CE9D203